MLCGCCCWGLLPGLRSQVAKSRAATVARLPFTVTWRPSKSRSALPRPSLLTKDMFEQTLYALCLYSVYLKSLDPCLPRTPFTESRECP